MLFDIPFVADWNKIGDYRQRQTDHSNTRENSSFRSKLTGNKLENIGYTGQIAVTNVKTAHVLTTISKSVIKY